MVANKGKRNRVAPIDTKAGAGGGRPAGQLVDRGRGLGVPEVERVDSPRAPSRLDGELAPHRAEGEPQQQPEQQRRPRENQVAPVADEGM